jgi:AraC-like DNA-binding protein
MLSCATQSFNEPAEYAAAIRGANAELTIVRGGSFSARTTAFDLHALRGQRFSERIPRILHAETPGDVEFLFHTKPGPCFVQNGVEVTSKNVVRRGPLRSYNQRSSGPVCWGSLSLPVENLRCLVATVAGCDMELSPNEVVVTPSPNALKTLRRMHAAAGRIAQDTPELIEEPAIARGLEQVLMQALGGCLETDAIQRRTSAQQRHHVIMQRFHAMLNADPDRPVYVLEMARAVGASVRTLSVCCHEHLGVGPMKYLWLRRMHLARKALRYADPATSTVTDVATQYGFWQFGRFAAEYKSLFGELPSVTCRRPRA